MGPLYQFQSALAEDIPKTGILPFMGVGETIKVEVPDVQRHCGEFIRLDDGECRALDSSGYPERTEQMSGKGGLAGAKIALEFDDRVAHLRCVRKCLGGPLGGDFVRPRQSLGHRTF